LQRKFRLGAPTENFSFA